MNYATQPWKTLGLGQFKFMQEVICSHEFSDLAVNLSTADLQDRLDWMWNLHQKGEISYEQALSGVYNTENLSQETISSLISQRIDAGGDGLHLAVGSRCFLVSGGITKEVEITSVTADFSCANGGLYPINLGLKNNNESFDEWFDEWFDCFGTSVNGDQLLSHPPVKQFSADELEECYQYFIENLYANFRWTEYATQVTSALARIKYSKKLWAQFQADFDLTKYPITQEAYNSLVMTFAETHLKAYE